MRHYRRGAHEFLKSTIARFQTYAFGTLSPEEAQRVKEVHDVFFNGWPGGTLDFENDPKWPEALQKRLKARRHVISELGSGDPQRQRKVLQDEKGIDWVLNEERTRNQRLRAIPYFDEIPTADLNLRSARTFCESDIAERPNFDKETDAWRRQKFPDIEDPAIRKEASLIWRWSGVFLADRLIRFTASDLENSVVTEKMLENYRLYLGRITVEREFLTRLENIAKVASAPIPLRMQSYAEFMRDLAVQDGLKQYWRRLEQKRLEIEFGWIWRVEEKILHKPPPQVGSEGGSGGLPPAAQKSDK